MLSADEPSEIRSENESQHNMSDENSEETRSKNEHRGENNSNVEKISNVTESTESEPTSRYNLRPNRGVPGIRLEHGMCNPKNSQTYDHHNFVQVECAGKLKKTQITLNTGTMIYHSYRMQ